MLGFLLTLGRKFPVGVAKYLTWPETSWARRITSTHHMWFIPYCLALGQVGGFYVLERVGKWGNQSS